MRTITTREAEVHFGTLIDEAGREPVTLTRDEAPAAVLMSAEAYARLKGEAKDALLAALKRTQDYAAAQSLNETELERLLADES